MTTTTATKARFSDPRLFGRRAARALTIARWLGPWADAQAMPPAEAIVEEDVARGVRLLRVSAAARGGGDGARGPGQRPVILLLPGLHFLGPDDLRFRRFAAVLAQTGAEIVAPYLSDFIGLALSPNLIAETEAALLAACERAGDAGRVSLMSISFGSIAALAIAARHPERLKRVVLFGGYRTYRTAVRFALGGAIDGFPADVRDPLNGPAVLVNLVDALLPEGQRAAFRAAALAFSRATWSRPGHAADDKRDGRHLRVGAEIAAGLSGEARALFRVACRLEGDPLAVAEEAMSRSATALAFLDPTPHLAHVRAPVACVHGRDDDVIPWTESEALARDLPDGRALITGLYGHTGRAGGAGGAAGIGALGREVRAMGGVLGALAGLAD